MPGPNDIWSKWFIPQLKLRIRMIKLFLTKTNLLAFAPDSIWNIVVDYVCEDPVIVDIILNMSDALVIHVDFSRYIRLSWGHDGIGETTELELAQVDERFSWREFYLAGCEVLEALLILPIVDSDGNESERIYTHACIGRLRDNLYTQLSAQ